MGARRRRERARNWKSMKIMKENFPNLVNEIDMQVQEVQTVPNNIDARKPTLRRFIIKTPKVKDRES